MDTNFLDSQSVRATAEAKLFNTPVIGAVHQSANELIYELQVHQVELEMQNEELRRNHLHMEESRNRYSELYDGAPVGYLQLTQEGLISEVNLTAAKLLGVQCKKLISRRFASLVMPQNGDQWYLFFATIMKQKQRLTIKLMLKGCNDTEFPVQLDCLPVNSMLHITLIDTSQFKQTSAALCEAETLALLIAERRKAEITCDEAYSRLNKTASLLFGMVYQLHLRADGRFCFPFVSEGIRNLYRLNPEEVIDDASKLFALIHPEDYEKLIDNLQKSALDLSPFVHEYRVLLEDGTLRWLLDNSMPLREADGSTLWHGMTTDITEQKLIGRKLSYAYAFNNSILNSLSAHIAVLNNTGIITATNDAWRHFARDNGLPEASQFMLGANYLKACGRTINNPYGEEANAALTGITAVLNGELDAFHLVYPCHSPDIQRWFQMNVTCLQGSTEGVVVSHENITDRHEIQVLLEHKEQMLSESQRITHIGSWSVDLKTGYLNWSDEAYQIYGVTKAAFEHTWAGFVRIIHPDDRALMQRWIKNCRAGNVPAEQNFRVVLPDGTIRFIRASGELQFDNMNKPFRMSGSGQDITESNDRDQREKEHLDQLAHITRLGLMGDMASGIVHEVNQPLTAITNYSQACLNFLKAENSDRDKLVEILQKIQQQALRTAEIIQKMRAFIKSHVMRPLKTDVNALIKSVNILCTAIVKENDIHLILELADNLPMINVDTIQIEQVIINLVKNSVEALQSLPQTTPRQITIQSQLTPDNKLQISVKDNGPGLSEDQQHKIMTPFYTTKPDGMGIGLSISRSIIESHKGTLHFDSLLGKGTDFYITLPIG